MLVLVDLDDDDPTDSVRSRFEKNGKILLCDLKKFKIIKFKTRN